VLSKQAHIKELDTKQDASFIPQYVALLLLYQRSTIFAFVLYIPPAATSFNLTKGSSGLSSVSPLSELSMIGCDHFQSAFANELHEREMLSSISDSVQLKQGKKV
jgi:hypothetical protein